MDAEDHWRSPAGVRLELPGGVFPGLPGTSAYESGAVLRHDSGWGGAELGLSPQRQGWHRPHGTAALRGGPGAVDPLSEVAAEMDDEEVSLGLPELSAFCGELCSDRHLSGNLQGGDSFGDLSNPAEGTAECGGATVWAAEQ